MAKHFWSEHSLSFFFLSLISFEAHGMYTLRTYRMGRAQQEMAKHCWSEHILSFFFSLTSVETRITCKHFSTLVEYSDFRSGLIQFALENLTSHIIWMSPYGPRSQKKILKNHAEFKTWQFSPRIFILK